MFPGAITPVPFEKTPVRFADPPAVIDVGFAVKLVMAGVETCLRPAEPMQPVRLHTPRIIAQISGV
jgi:hypothetical protein